MLKADIILKDNTMLNKVMLFKDQNLGESQILTESEAIKYLHDNRILFFCGKYVQGGLSPSQIMHYHLYAGKEGELDSRIKDFVYESVWHNRTDIADFIIEYKDRLSEILR
ncbi:hypothetical protein [Cytobacillus praedii]|uniref:Uncharacterized protein n=1 Tax=Cytobacillus praedii TaxID=1742358 RepID=A0A4R1ALD3_9BACI|nr:hypothetical protein [Cytobacillus praedii]TCJ00007.1 hypothetical protein E0Y62_27000 [Cytobacillus praedii]